MWVTQAMGSDTMTLIMDFTTSAYDILDSLFLIVGKWNLTCFSQKQLKHGLYSPLSFCPSELRLCPKNLAVFLPWAQMALGTGGHVPPILYVLKVVNITDTSTSSPPVQKSHLHHWFLHCRYMDLWLSPSCSSDTSVQEKTATTGASTHATFLTSTTLWRHLHRSREPSQQPCGNLKGRLPQTLTC